jgi:hypothetical protein
MQIKNVAVMPWHEIQELIEKHLNSQGYTINPSIKKTVDNSFNLTVGILPISTRHQHPSPKKN